MPKVLIVFLGGTCSRMDYLGEPGKAAGFPGGEIVAWLADTYASAGKTEFDDYLALNGVGTGNLDHHKYPPRLQAIKYSQAQGILAGSGSDEIREAVIEHVLERKFTQVKLIGWSRGGYNAIRIAHALFDKCPEVEVDILAFDPVPGTGNRTEDCLTLKSNVRNYSAYLALHEHTSGFQPVYPEPTPENIRTEIRVRTLPGNHSALVGGISGALVADQLQPLTELTRILAMQDLVTFGIEEFQAPLDEMRRQKSMDQRFIDLSHLETHYKKLENSAIIYGAFASSKPIPLHDGLIVHHRQICKGIGAEQWKFMDDVPECRHNPASKTIQIEQAFGLQSDTCSVHRDHNDTRIAEKIHAGMIIHPIPVSISSDYIRELSAVSEYIKARHEVRGQDQVLSAPMNYVQAKVNEAIAEYLKAKAQAPDLGASLYSSFSGNIVLDPECLEQVFFLAAQSGNAAFLDYYIQNFCFALIDDKGESSPVINHGESLLTAKNEEGLTALGLAAKHGHLNFIKQLLAQGQISEKLKYDAMMVAMIAKQKTVFDYLNANFDHSNQWALVNAELVARERSRERSREAAQEAMLEEHRLREVLLQEAIKNLRHVSPLQMQLQKAKSRLKPFVAPLAPVVAPLAPAATVMPFLNARRIGLGLASSACLTYAAGVGLTALGQINLVSVIEPFFMATTFASPVAIIALAACALALILCSGEYIYSASQAAAIRP